ncbi:MAG: hypothetical protein AAF563_03520 [Pseudomonadota bacterium]
MTKAVTRPSKARTYATYLDMVTEPLIPSVADERMTEDAVGTIGTIALGDAVPPPAGIEIPMERPQPGFDISLGYASAFGNKSAIHAATNCAWNDSSRAFASVGAIEASDCFLWAQLDNFWFEFDLREPQTVAASVYFSPIPALGEEQEAGRSGSGALRKLAPQQIDSACAGFERLIGDFNADDRAILIGMMRAYESTKPTILCGAMRGRRPVAVRLVLAFEDIPEAAAYLRKIGLAGHDDALRSVQDSYGDLTKWVLLGITPLEPDSHKIGLELYAPNGWMRHNGDDRRLINRMVEGGHCHPVIAQAILDYPGVQVVATGHERWPVVPRRDGFAKSSTRYPVCVRRFHHVKLTLNRGENTQFKAYLASHFQWCRV